MMKIVLMVMFTLVGVVVEAKKVAWAPSCTFKPEPFPTVEEAQAEIDRRRKGQFPWRSRDGILHRVRFGDRSDGERVRSVVNCIVSNILEEAYVPADDLLEPWTDVRSRFIFLADLIPQEDYPMAMDQLMAIADWVGKFELMKVSDRDEDLAKIRQEHGISDEYFARRSLYDRRDMYNRSGTSGKRFLLDHAAYHILWERKELSLKEREAVLEEFLRRAKATEEDRSDIAKNRKVYERGRGNRPTNNPVPSLPQRQAR